MKALLTTTAILEGVTGLILTVAPSFLVSVLLGVAIRDPAAILLGRLSGAALISIAVACWLSRNDTLPSVMVKAMVVYNIAATSLLAYAGLAARLSGPGLWPVVLLHAGMAAWCISALWRSQ
jgi:hypothetical protein